MNAPRGIWGHMARIQSGFFFRRSPDLWSGFFTHSIFTLPQQLNLPPLSGSACRNHVHAPVTGQWEDWHWLGRSSPRTAYEQLLRCNCLSANARLRATACIMIWLFHVNMTISQYGCQAVSSIQNRPTPWKDKKKGPTFKKVDGSVYSTNEKRGMRMSFSREVVSKTIRKASLRCP